MHRKRIAQLNYDAWGRAKTLHDHSVFRGMWSFNIPRRVWKEALDGVYLNTFTGATSVDGGLKFTGLTGFTRTLQSLRHPRYQPNRGHLWSSALWLPDEREANTVREFGLGTPDNRAVFRVKDGLLYAVIRRNGVDVVEQLISEVPYSATFDITKGHLYDIQVQWRGVGDYFFFVDQVLVTTVKNLGVKGEGALPTVDVPAMGAWFSVTGDADIRAGCVDISSEGGGEELRQYFSQSSPMDISTMTVSPLYTDGVAIMALKVDTTFNGKYNSRDAVLNRITTFCKDQSVTGVWATRDPSVIGAIANNADPSLGWAQVAGSDSPMRYMLGGNGSTLATTFQTNHTSANTRLLVTKRVGIDVPAVLDNPNKENTPFYLTNGDYIIVTSRPDSANKNVGATIEWAEEI